MNNAKHNRIYNVAIRDILKGRNQHYALSLNHGCAKTSFAVIRCVGSVNKHLDIKFCASTLIAFQSLLGKGTGPLPTCNISLYPTIFIATPVRRPISDTHLIKHHAKAPQVYCCVYVRCLHCHSVSYIFDLRREIIEGSTF